MNKLFDPANIEVSLPNSDLADNVAKITVIGVGGGGCNMVDHMIREGISRVNLVVANTDLQVLKSSKAPTTIQLGSELTKGLGAGMKPEVGRDSALESYDEILDSLASADIVFIATGLGGGTGTGAAAVIAKAAKEVGALTVSVVTRPFRWEGNKRAGLANMGLEELKEESDSIIIVSNERLLKITDQNSTLKEAFKTVDNILFQAVNGMSEVILNHGTNDVNTDFADVKTVMQHRGIALMGIGEAIGENAAMDALNCAIESPLLEQMELSDAKGILIHFNVHPGFSLIAISEVMDHLYSMANENVEIIFGTTTESELDENKVRITIVATGFKTIADEMDSKKKPVVSKEKLNQQQNERVDDYNIPPLMRNYHLKYQLK
jgi:cell division protein FtsZ